MSNSGFNLPTGLKAGPLTIDAATGAITTSGNVRVTGGGTFVGTNAPGSAPILTPSTDVKLLLNMNGSNGSTSFTDSSTVARSVTAAGNTQLSTSVKKYGTASAYFDGTGDYISCLNWGTLTPSDTITVECWVYKTNAPTGYETFFNFRSQPGQGAGYACGLATNGTFFLSDAASGSANSTATVALNTWQHVAMVYDGNAGKLYVNGTLVLTYNTQVSNAYGVCDEFYVGCWDPGINNQFNGYIDDLRIVKGQAVYTGTFTPPATQLTTTI